MRELLRQPLVLAALVACATVSAPQAGDAAPPRDVSEEWAPSCDRGCLIGFVDRYLSALADRAPDRLPVSGTLRFTENTNELKLGQGLWATASGLGTYRQYFADPAAAQAGFIGTVRENGTPAILALRLRIDAGAIAEIEQIVARSPGGARAFETTGRPKPLWDQAIGPSARRSREELAAIANAYFESILHSDGSLAPFDKDCRRAENGEYSTGNPDPSLVWSKEFPAFRPFAMGCAEQMSTRIWSYIRDIRSRRFPLIDEERGEVVAFIMFDHPATVPYADVPGVGRVPTPSIYMKPTSMEIMEAFKIVDGRILEIAAEGDWLPFGQKSGW